MRIFARLARAALVFSYVLFASFVWPAPRVFAQTTERPAAFDSANRLLVVTPPAAARLRLAVPVWPVSGEYREARLYAVQGSDVFTLVVQRLDGSVDRFQLSRSQREALGSAIDASLLADRLRGGAPGSDIVSEPAGNSFARRQTVLAAAVYGPLAASLASDAGSAGALYLVVTGGTFFASYGAAQSSGITRAQSDLAGDLGLAAAGGAYLTSYAATGNSDRGVRVATLLSGFAGTIAGAALGRTLNDAEAHAATFGIETAAVIGVAASAAANLDQRPAAAMVTALGAMGYFAGVALPRRTSYELTAGDVEATGTVGLIAALYGGIALASVDHPSTREVAAILAPSYLAGLVLGSHALARNYDLTQSQANIFKVGAGAGALIGLAVPTLSGGGGTAATAAAALGATIGAAAIASTFSTRSSALGSVGALRSRTETTATSQFSIMFPGAVGVFSGRPGNYVLAQWRF